MIPVGCAGDIVGEKYLGEDKYDPVDKSDPVDNSDPVGEMGEIAGVGKVTLIILVPGGVTERRFPRVIGSILMGFNAMRPEVIGNPVGTKTSVLPTICTGRA